VVLKLGHNVSRSCHGGKTADRWLAGLVALFVLPAVLGTSTIRFAQASPFETQPILSDGQDDDADWSILCALPEETTKELSSTNAKTQVIGTICCLAICRSSITSAGRLPLIALADSPLRFKRPQRAGSSDDPDSPH